MRLEYADPTGLAPAPLNALGACAAPSVWLEDGPGERLFQRLPPSFNDDPQECALFDLRGPITLAYPPAFVAGVRDAHLVGWRTLITPDGRFFDDDCPLTAQDRAHKLDRLALADPFNNENTGLRRIDEAGGFTLDLAGRAEHDIQGPVLLLTSSEPTSYGAFLFRVLPKLAGLPGFSGRDGLGDMQALVYAPGASFQHLLALAGLEEGRLIQQDFTATYRIVQAVVPGLRNPHGFLDAASQAMLAQLRARFGAPARTRRLYVSRLNYPGAGRIMLNEAELIARLTAIGFEVVEPQWMTGEAQLHAFSAAEMVVGPCGSGLFNTVFCHPGTKLINIQSEPGWIHQYCCLHTSSLLDYGIFQARASYVDPHNPHKPFTVDIDALMRRVQDFAAQPMRQ